MIASYVHDNPVWVVESSPQDTSLAITSEYSKIGFKTTTIWRLENQDRPKDDGEEEQSSHVDAQALINLGTLTTNNSRLVHSVKWHPTKDHILTSDSSELNVWSLGGSKGPQVCVIKFSVNFYNLRIFNNFCKFNYRSCICWAVVA